MLAYVQVFPYMSSFFRLQNTLMFQKYSGFWSLLTATLIFSVVVTCVTVCSSSRSRFNFRTYFTHFRSIRTHDRTTRLRTFISNCVQYSGGRVVRRLVLMSIYRIPAMGKRNSKFRDEVQNKYSCFRNVRDEWEAECLVCKRGT
jgi:hypothetical protein